MISEMIQIASEAGGEPIAAEPIWLGAAILFEVFIIALVLGVGLRGKKKKPKKAE